MKRVFALLLALFAFALSWAGVESSQPDRKIAPGDKLRMTCVEEPSLDKTYTVTADGLMLIDFLGAIQVNGLTIRQAAERISARLLEDRILRRATLSLEFASAPAATDRQVKIAGAVRNRDAVTWVEGMRLSDVIRIAVPENSADLTKIEIVRPGGSPQTIDFSRFNPANNAGNPLLQAGDEIRFPDRTGTVPGGTGPTQPPIVTPPTTVPPANGGAASGYVFVIGGVNRPGSQLFRSGMTLGDALGAAGGFSDRGDRTKVRVERRGEQARVLDFSQGANGVFALLPNDQVIVETTADRLFVQVLGAVRNPGLVPYREGLTLSQAIQQAGGLEGGAKAKDVVVRTGGGVRKVNFEDVIRGFRGDSMLGAGDTIEVPGNGRRTSPAPAPQPGPSERGGGSKSKTSETILVAAGAVLLFILFGR